MKKSVAEILEAIELEAALISNAADLDGYANLCPNESDKGIYKRAALKNKTLALIAIDRLLTKYEND